MFKNSLALLSILHLLVDGLCSCCLFSSALSVSPWNMVVLMLTYNFLAFVSQPLTGLLLDILRQEKLYLGAILLLLLSGSACFLLREAWIIVPGIVMLGLGNSLFHVYGGRRTAVASMNSPKELGIFVSTGAVGIAIGSSSSSLCLQLILMAAIAVFIMIAMRVCSCVPLTSMSVEECRHDTSIYMGAQWFVIFAVLSVVFIRSFYVTFISAGSLSLLLLCAAATLGKASGGYISSLLGCRDTIFYSMLLAGVASFFFWASDMFVYLAVFLISISMPLTLCLANKCFMRYEGFSFGLLAAVLFPGYFFAKSFQGLFISSIISYALVPTIVIEAIVLLLQKERRSMVLFVSVLGNVLTNVPLNLLVHEYAISTPYIIVMEVLVMVIEALLYYTVTKDLRRSVRYSVLCNMISYTLGVIMYDSAT